MGTPDLLASECREWLCKSRADLQSARALLSAAPPLTDTAAFHTQQAAEKALKALLVPHAVDFAKTHDLAVVGQACIAVDPTIQAEATEAASLSDLAWQHRYPSGRPDPSEQEARDALDLAQRVYDSVLARVPAAARP